MENIIVILVCLINGFIFFILGISAKKSSKPANFWSGKEVKSEDIIDIAAYNNECGNMWINYSLVYFFGMGLSIVGKGVLAGWVVGLGVSVGIGLLIIKYISIEKKYSIKNKVDDL